MYPMGIGEIIVCMCVYVCVYGYGCECTPYHTLEGYELMVRISP
jgi:hypothetical protein